MYFQISDGEWKLTFPFKGDFEKTLLCHSELARRNLNVVGLVSESIFCLSQLNKDPELILKQVQHMIHDETLDFKASLK